jgi:uncharacterized protein (TIGR00661 family)
MGATGLREVIFPCNMATIFYSMAGEGRGHATRVRAIVEDLRRRHRVVLFAPGQAHDLLAPIYRDSDVEVRPIDGLTFRYRPDGSVDYFRSVVESAKGLPGYSRRIEELRKQIVVDRPDLVVTDFEPLLPRAAERAGVPYVSIDHQHFLTTYSMRGLPLYQRIHALLIGASVNLFHARQDLTIVSAFFRPPLRIGAGSKVRQVGVLLGQDILERTPSDEEFLLVYLRRGTPRRVFRALANCGLPARIYGPGMLGIDGPLTFCSVDRQDFVEDLSRCRALVTTAGNQVVGEALHLGKPVLALPEPGNWEQGLNGFFLERMGVGACASMRTLRSKVIREFLAKLDSFRAAMPRGNAGGNAEVSRILEDFMASLPERKRETFSRRILRSAFQQAAA